MCLFVELGEVGEPGNIGWIHLKFLVTEFTIYCITKLLSLSFNHIYIGL